jgi:pimeloyl-ACP methyl ester carboxylesterase
LYYEIQKPKTEIKSTILLISRNANTLLFWPQEFIQAFLDNGYQVIRFDHRGIGCSDRMLNWTKKSGYTLEDMAHDAKAVLDCLKIEKAHIIGASMGGMIAQRFAYLFPEVTQSLCSIMSSGYFYDPELVAVNKSMKRRFRAVMLGFVGAKNNLRKQLKIHLAVRNLWVGKGAYALNVKKHLNEIFYEIKFRKGYYRKSFEQHVAAIKKSGSFLEKLKSITSPSLVIHGDSDVLIDIKHAKKYVTCLKNVKSYYLSGMGHDLPNNFINPISARVLDFIDDSSN